MWCALALGISQPTRAQEAVAPATDPIIAQALDSMGTEPAARLRVILLGIDRDQEELVRPVLEDLIAAQLSEEQLAGLARRFGSAPLVKLASNEALQPESRQFSRSVLTATQNQARDPQRIAALIEQLANPEQARVRGALYELARARDAAVMPLIELLADPASTVPRPVLARAFSMLGPDGAPPLAAIIAAPDGSLRIAALEAAGYTQQRELGVHVLARLYVGEDDAERAAAAVALEQIYGVLPPSADEGLRAIAARAEDLFERTRLVDPSQEVIVPLWRWDEASDSLLVEMVTRRVALASESSLLAGHALAVDPENAKLRRLYILARLTADVVRASADVPLARGEGSAADAVIAFGAAAVNDALRAGLAGRHYAAATALADLLGEHGTRELLAAGAPQESPLILAVNCPDRRVRLAALRAIANLDPAWPYPGSADYLQALLHLAGGHGAPRALVASPQAGAAPATASLLTQLGFVAETYGDAREAVRAALERADCELILIDATFLGTTVNDALASLRRDYRTADIPIGVLASPEFEQAAGRLVRRYERTSVVLRPHDSAALAVQLDGLLRQQGQRPITPQLRQAQARVALQWLAQADPFEEEFYELTRVHAVALLALNDAELSPLGVQILARLGLPESQRALADVVAATGRPEGLRELAATAFALHVHQYGTLLTTDEIVAQYDRFNSSDRNDAVSRRLLGALLDAIEARSLGSVPQVPLPANPSAGP